MDRPCEKCLKHISGSCSSWECKPETLAEHDAKITGDSIGKEQLMDIMAEAVGLFITQCGEMAEKNWCPSQVDMLERLFGAVIADCEYAEWQKGIENE